jgi:peroxiredoxin
VTPRSLVRAIAAALTCAGLLACGGSERPEASASAQAASAGSAESGAANAEPVGSGSARGAGHEGHDHAQRAERPLPAFGGFTLDGERLEVSKLIGKRLLLFFFNPEVPDAAVAATAVSRISPRRGSQNFEIIGIAIGSNREAALSFSRVHGVDYRVIDDSSATIANMLGLQLPVALLGVDPDGYVVFGLANFAIDAPNPDSLIEGQIRSAMRLPERDGDPAPSDRPVAPLFEAKPMDGGEPFRLADHRGEAVVLVFFLHSCPHCHEFLAFMKEQLAGLPEGKRPLLVGIEVTGKTFAVRESLKREGLDFFPVLLDDDGSIRNAYGVFAGVPDTYLIDKQGRIVAHVEGWVADVDGPLMRMRMAKATGAPIPMLLRSKGFSGSEVCGVCHESEHDTWLITRHAVAFDTLVRHGADTDAECVSCHVVGFGAEGGFDMATRAAALENVGCESCHGRGGPHLSPGSPGESYASACLVCHDQKHSLGFEYASFVPRISHAANAAILALPAEERRRVLEERGAVRKDLLPTSAAYVGSEACASCHEPEHASWLAGPHARAMKTLAAAGKDGLRECQACHTTAFGKPGGFSAETAASTPDLARVGCESCHGPGGDHVAEDAAKLGTIVALGDKCDSCVILQICGSCHDEANDPGFEFEVKAKIDAIRHGTTEAGTGKPLDHPARRGGGEAELPALLGRAFAAADDRNAAWTAP